MATSNTLYDDPTVYDILHAPGAAEELDGLQRMADRWTTAPTLADGGVWLEPACGTGRLLRAVARRNGRVIGFDASRVMVDDANRRLARLGFDGLACAKMADMTGFVGRGSDKACAPASISFAFNPINSFRHLMTDADALAHLDQMGKALAPGGAYAVGMSITTYGLEPPTEDTWEASRGPCRVHQFIQYDPPTGRNGGTRVERVISYITVTTPSADRTLESTYALRTYDLVQWRDLIDRSAMRIAAVTDQDGHDAEETQLGYRFFILRPRERR